MFAIATSEAVPTETTAAEIGGRRISYDTLGTVNVLPPEVGRLRAARLAAENPDVVALTRGSSVLLVPFTAPVPGTGGCFHCLERRWQLLRGEDERNALELGASMEAAATAPFLTGFGRSLVESTLESLADTDWPTTEAGLTQVFHVRLDAGAMTRYPLTADADCPLCDLREDDSAEAAALVLTPQPKPTPDATRVRSIHDYPLDPDTYANPICGMLGTVAGRAYDSTTTAPVTGYTRIRGDYHLHEFFWSGHADNFADSQILGILEGLERHSGLRERRIRPAVVDTFENVREHALDPRSVGLYPDIFYELIGSRFTTFRDDLPIPWVWAHSLRDNRQVLVPHAFVYYLINDPATNFLQECSNGCATGGSREEATLYGLLELLERDAFLNAWYGKAPLPEIDTSTCRSPQIRMMVDRLSLMGYDVRMFDNRIDLPVPCVTGVAVRRDGGLGTLSFAAGAGLDPEDAIRAALCEIASYVPSFPERVAEHLDLVRSMQEDYLVVQELKHHALLYGVPEMAQHADFLLAQDREPQSVQELYAEWERDRPRTGDLTDDLNAVVQAITDRGLDVLMADQTSPEQRSVGLTTVSTIVPGLIPIDFGWTMQRALSMRRLRVAPVAAGWRETELSADDLNMHPHPFP